MITNDTKALQKCANSEKETCSLSLNSQNDFQVESLKKQQIMATTRIKGGPAFVPLGASLIAPLSKPEHLSGAETRKRAAKDRLEVNFVFYFILKLNNLKMQRCAEASERLKAILLPAGSKRTASQSIPECQDEPKLKVFKKNLLVVFYCYFLRFLR